MSRTYKKEKGIPKMRGVKNILKAKRLSSRRVRHSNESDPSVLQKIRKREILDREGLTIY